MTRFVYQLKHFFYQWCTVVSSGDNRVLQSSIKTKTGYYTDTGYLPILLWIKSGLDKVKEFMGKIKVFHLDRSKQVSVVNLFKNHIVLHCK